MSKPKTLEQSDAIRHEWDDYDGLVWDEPSDDPQEQAFRDCVNDRDREVRRG